MRKSQRVFLKECFSCHGSRAGIHSVQSYARIFGPQTIRPPQLVESDAQRESRETVLWKNNQYDFGLLQGLWQRAN